jgi:alpha-ketoglutarate-dependent taurine dioxygenase
MNTSAAPLSISRPEHEAHAMLDQRWAGHLASWQALVGADLGQRHLIMISDDCTDELDQALTRGISLDTRRAELIEAMPCCAALAMDLRAELFERSGFVVLDRLPVKRYEAAQNKQLAGLLGSLISPLMAQDRAGTRLYDVLDNGGADGAIRRSKTNQAQPFHTDGAWLQPPPALIGLFCIQPALSGGSSQLASVPVALSRLVQEDDSIDLDELFAPVYWNCMGEQREGALPYSRLPVLDSESPSAALRYYVDYVRTGSKLAGQTVAPHIESLFRRIDQALADTAIKPFGLQAGQLQYVNNGWLVHARGAFSDLEVGERGRHLVRIWNEYP